MNRFLVLFLMCLLIFSFSERLCAEDFFLIVENLRSEYQVPGAAVALVEKGEIIFLQGFGYKDLQAEKPVTADTIFQVASISKPIAAIGFLRLVQEGKWSLDDPVQNYLQSWELPQSEYGHAGITLRRVLSHTAGLGPGGYIGYRSIQEKPDLIEALQGTAKGSRGVKIVGSPGEEFQYAGGGYTVLEMALQDATGQDFGEFMKTEVLESLGMKNSTYDWDEKMAQQLATPYSVYEGVLPNYLFTERAAAGLYSTAGDLAIFIQYLLGIYEQRKDSDLKEIFTPVGDGYGLGLQVIELPDGRTLVGHGGSNRGWKANMLLILEDGAGIVILTNSDRGMPFFRDLTNYWLDQQGTDYEISTPGRVMMYFIDLYQRIGLWFLRL